MWEVKVQLNPDHADLLDEFLAESETEEWHVYVEPYAKQAHLTGYFEEEGAAHSGWEALRSELPAGLEMGEAVFQVLQDRDWQEAYKAHFHRWDFGGLHWVPVWEREEFELPAGEEVVWLDPGMAFGTGNHETTRLCVERMMEFRRECQESGQPLAEVEVLDAGCGSGILAISAGKCGFGRVAGFDLDPVAVEVSLENTELNNLVGQIEFYEGDLITGLQGRAVDLLIANIQADVLCRHAEDLARALKPKGRMVLSGILAAELPEVRACFEKILSGATFSTRQLGEWSDLVASRA